MSCKNKDNSKKNKEKKIVCETCKCSYDKDNKFKVECINCDDENDITIICEICNHIDNDENNKKEICLKKCDIDGTLENTIYITCTDYTEDLD